ncbi:hypothetical protein ACFLSZ_01045 [Candidatus Bipolaricaulota bacterium]
MRNALILTGVWLGILVAAYAIVFWDQGIDRPLPISLLEEQVRVSAPEYVHPDGLFSLSVPMGWQVEADIEYAEMTDPNANITVWVIAVNTMDLDVLLNEALALTDLETKFEVTTGGLPEDAWTGEEVSVIYQSEGEGDVLTVRAQRPNQWAVAMLARGPERAIEALSENLEWIWSELAVPADEFLVL